MQKRYREEMHVITLPYNSKVLQRTAFNFGLPNLTGSPQAATGPKGYQKQRGLLFSKIYGGYIWFDK